MNDDRPVRSLPARTPEAEDLHQRQLTACGEETLLETGHLVDGEWTIRVCPECWTTASELGGGRRGCGIHSIQDYDFIRVSVKPVEEHKSAEAEVLTEAARDAGATSVVRDRLSSLAI